MDDATKAALASRGLLVLDDTLVTPTAVLKELTRLGADLSLWTLPDANVYSKLHEMPPVLRMPIDGGFVMMLATPPSRVSHVEVSMDGTLDARAEFYEFEPSSTLQRDRGEVAFYGFSNIFNGSCDADVRAGLDVDVRDAVVLRSLVMVAFEHIGARRSIVMPAATPYLSNPRSNLRPVGRWHIAEISLGLDVSALHTRAPLHRVVVATDEAVRMFSLQSLRSGVTLAGETLHVVRDYSDADLRALVDVTSALARTFDLSVSAVADVLLHKWDNYKPELSLYVQYNPVITEVVEF